MTPVYYKGAEDIIKIHSFYILFIFSFIISIFISNCQAFAVEGIWRDYNNLKELVKDIRNGDKDDDKMNYDKFPGVYTTNVGLGRAYSATGDFKKALQYMKAALPQAPDELNKNSVTAMIKKLEEGKDVNQ